MTTPILARPYSVYRVGPCLSIKHINNVLMNLLTLYVRSISFTPRPRTGAASQSAQTRATETQKPPIRSASLSSSCQRSWFDAFRRPRRVSPMSLQRLPLNR
jgi:hypothetical protein